MIYAAVFAVACCIGLGLMYYLRAQTAYEAARREHDAQRARLKAQLGTDYIEANDDYRKP